MVVSVELGELYAFHYISPDIANRKQGWHQFDLQSEYLRMGLSSDNWTLTNINREYEVSWAITGGVFLKLILQLI